TGDEEEEQHGDEVLDRDDLVVGAYAEIAPRAVLLALAQRRRAPDDPPKRVVEEAQTAQPAENREAQAHQDRDVVLVRLALRGRVDPDVRPDPMSERVAADAQRDRPDHVEAEQLAPGRRCADPTLAHRDTG